MILWYCDIDNELTSQLFNPCGCPRPWPGPMGGERTFLSMNLDRPQSLSYFVPGSTTMNLPFVIWRSKPKLASVRIRQKYFQSRWLFHRRTKASRYRLMSAVGIALMDWWCVYIDIAKAGLVRSNGRVIKMMDVQCARLTNGLTQEAGKSLVLDTRPLVLGA